MSAQAGTRKSLILGATTAILSLLLQPSGVFAGGNDCNANGEDDTIDLLQCDGDPGCRDCNGNEILDSCDIDAGALDVDANGIPDECCPPPCFALLPAEPNIAKQMFISFRIPEELSGTEFAIRVEFTSLFHPDPPWPGAPDPDLSGDEGQYRYVNTMRDSNSELTFECLDSIAFQTSYPCAFVSCEPEYRDWAADFGGQTIQMTGRGILPSSLYTVDVIPTSCAGMEDACPLSAPSLPIRTTFYADSNADGKVNVSDVIAAVDSRRDIAGAYSETFVFLNTLVLGDGTQSFDIYTYKNNIIFAIDRLRGIALPTVFAPPDCP